MKKIFKVLSVVLTIALLSTFIVACSKSSSLVGTWKKVDTKAGSNGFTKFEFFSDGTYSSNQVNYSGNYSVDGDRLKLSGILVETKTFTFEIEGDTLKLYTDGYKTPIEYKKQ